MSTVIPPAVAAEIIAQANATDGSMRALDKVAREHGLLLPELRALTASADETPAAATPTPAAAGRRVCTGCNTEKPLNDFYEQKNGRDGLMSQCIRCNNDRPPSELRILRNRARTRATKRLIDAHAAEFSRLIEEETVKARAEHEQVKAEAARKGQHDAPIARLKPGPRRQGEQITDRLDVARCTTCHTHHDADHECPSCGDTTPESALPVKPWEVRTWAVEQGLPVPIRGPIPDAVQAAYDARNDLDLSRLVGFQAIAAEAGVTGNQAYMWHQRRASNGFPEAIASTHAPRHPGDKRKTPLFDVTAVRAWLSTHHTRAQARTREDAAS